VPKLMGFFMFFTIIELELGRPKRTVTIRVYGDCNNSQFEQKTG